MNGEVGVEDDMVDAVESIEMFETIDVVVALYKHCNKRYKEKV